MRHSNSQEPLYVERGFTLVELILYVSIASSILLLATMSAISLLDVRLKNKAIAEVEQQGTHALSTILRVIRNGEAVTFPTPGIASTTLTMNTYTVGEDPTRFEVVNQELRMIRGVTAAVPLTSNRAQVTSFQVMNVSRPGTPGSVRVYLTVRFAQQGAKVLYAYSKTFIGTATLRQP
jgi:type II secretory pathway pseudopilin PulG